MTFCEECAEPVLDGGSKCIRCETKPVRRAGADSRAVSGSAASDESGISVSDLVMMDDIARLCQKIWPDLPTIEESDDGTQPPNHRI